MRDNIKNSNYFKKYLLELGEDIDNETDFEDLSTLLFQKIMAKYSIGEDIASLINDYNHMISAFIKSFDKESVSYNSILNVLSLSVIFNIKNIKKLETIIKKSEESNDYIIQFLLNSSNYDTYNVKWKKYLLLKDIIENYKNNKKEAEKKMKSYLDSWYSNNKNVYWYEAHKSKANIYFGYWCLEAAALTYLLDLDDSEYLNHKYYPKDLVKYARNKNFSEEYMINFSDGVFTPETQAKLYQLLSQITDEEIEAVREYCYRLLAKAGKKLGKRYKVSFVPIIPLQIILNNNSDIIQYGVHSNNIIKIVKMDGSKKGRFGEVLILAHETGHALLGHKNMKLKYGWGTRVMEKATDEVIKMYLMDKFPLFYQMYVLCRDTHHYRTKEGDYKEFFKDIISKMEQQWQRFKN